MLSSYGNELFILRKEEADIFDEAFAFDRTKSRLIEMQSEYWFTKNHKFYKENKNSSDDESK